jgi:hypothetical protein
VDKDAPEVLIILFDAMDHFFDVPLVEKAQYFFLELPAALAGDDPQGAPQSPCSAHGSPSDWHYDNFQVLKRGLRSVPCRISLNLMLGRINKRSSLFISVSDRGSVLC